MSAAPVVVPDIIYFILNEPFFFDPDDWIPVPDDFPTNGGELEGEVGDLGVGVAVGGGQVLEETLARLEVRGHLGEPDGRLHGLDLAEEGADGAEVVVAPVLEQSGRLGGYLPLARRQVAPRVNVATDLVDDRCDVVLLLGRREALAFVEDDLGLLAGLALLGLGDGGDEVGAAAGLDGAVGGLAGLVQLPVAARGLVGRVEGGMFEEAVGHERSASRAP